MCFEKNDPEKNAFDEYRNSNESLNAKYFHDLICSYCILFAKKLNKLIYDKYSETFWIRLYWREIYTIISLIHDYKTKIYFLSEKFSHKKLYVRVLEKSEFNNKKEIDFINNFNVDSQEKIISSILKIEKIKNFSLIINKNKSEGFSSKFSKKNENPEKLINLSRFKLGSTLNLMQTILINLFLKILKPKNKTKFNYNFKFQTWEGYDSLIESIICDDSKDLRIKIDKFLSRNIKPGKIMFASNEIYSNLDYKLKCFLAAEKGQILVGYQHGGYAYGTMKDSIFQSLEYNLDYFLSWGWENKNFKILPFATPSKYKKIKSKKEKNCDIIIVGTRQPIINFKLDNELSDKQKKEYLKTQIEILKKGKQLERKKFNLYFRPYPFKIPYDYDVSHTILKFIPNEKLILNGFNSIIRKTSLLIIDHPGTTIPISFQNNIPTILIWNPEHYSNYFSKEFSFILCKFKKQNIYFEKVENMIDFIMGHDKNTLAEWWNSRETQLLIKEYNSMFSIQEKFWLFKLFKIFKSL